MILHCHQCGAPLAEDQRYCLNCATRRVQPPLVERDPARRPEPVVADPSPRRIIAVRLFGRAGVVRLPGRRSSAALATGMLASGVLIGVAIGPAGLGSSPAATAGRIIALVTGQAQAKPAGATPAPTGNSAGTGSTPGGNSPTGSSSGPAPAPAPAPAARAGSSAATGNGAAAGTGASTSSGSTAPSSGSPATSPIATPRATTPPKPNLGGVVVSIDSAALSFDVADRKGKLFEVHSDKTPRVGAKFRLATKKLANGTLSAVRVIAVKGSPQTRVTARGVVSFVDPANARYALSVRGVSLLVSVGASAPAPPTVTPAPPTPPTTTTTPTTPTTIPPIPSDMPTPTTPAPTTPAAPPTTPTPTTPASSPTTAADSLPSVGQRLQVELSLPPPSAAGPAAILRETHRSNRGTARPPLELAGLLTTIDKVRRTITISADGPGLSSATIVLSFPASLALKKVSPPEAVVVHATAAADGSYTLTGVAADTDATTASDLRNAVGDFRPHAAKRARASSRSFRARTRPWLPRARSSG